MGVRFLHTSDWQLGMTRAFLSPEAQARYTDDQFAAVRALAEVARDLGCAFVVVAGDVFDSFHPARAVLARAIEALRAFTVPVFLLPGNHDPDNPAGCWSDGALADALPERVTVLRDGLPHPVPGAPAEVVGAPWPSRRPDVDLVAGVLTDLAPPASGTVRVLVGHGQVDALAPDRLDPALVRLGRLGRALADGVVHYVALGDRHSATEVAPAAWYSGAPLATDHGEVASNRALVVDLGSPAAPSPADGTAVPAGAGAGPGAGASAGDAGSTSAVTVTEVPIGGWHFVTERIDCAGADGVAAVAAFLDGIDDKERTVVKLALVGTLTLSEHQALQECLDRARDLLAAVQLSGSRTELVVVADDADVADLPVSGFARQAADELAIAARGTGQAADTARDALLLLTRLARRAS